MREGVRTHTHHCSQTTHHHPAAPRVQALADVTVVTLDWLNFHSSLHTVVDSAVPYLPLPSYQLPTLHIYSHFNVFKRENALVREIH